MRETVIQFGEGNFLRGFFDYFLHKLNESGLYDGKAVIIKPTSRGSCDRFRKQNCEYNLFLRGIENGEKVCEHTRITSVSRIINPYEEFEEFVKLASNPDIRFIVSNTTEAGIVFDEKCRQNDAPPSSFPAKLTVLLYERFKTGLNGFIILPCELIDNNGKELKDCVMRYADLWGLGEKFKDWTEKENSFADTLVDRIVTGYPFDEKETLCDLIGYDDLLLDTAEIFHLWVIEGDFEDELPLKRCGFNVVWTDDVSPYKKRKVRVLNGAHTAFVCVALLAGAETVGECMKDEAVYAFIRKCVYGEILPVLGETEDNLAFARAVEDRFANPYIKHRLRSIVLNCISKFAVRDLPTLLEYREKFGVYPDGLCLSLASVIYFYKNDEPDDDGDTVSFIKNTELYGILKNASLWGADISRLYEAVSVQLERIEKQGIVSAVKCIL